MIEVFYLFGVRLKYIYIYMKLVLGLHNVAEMLAGG